MINAAINAQLLPDEAPLRSLFMAELDRAGAGLDPVSAGPRRFGFIGPNSFDCTTEKRPTITVAALRDIIEEREVLFIHTRSPSTAPLSQARWLEVTRRVLDAHFPFGPPALVYLSTDDGLYQLGAVQADPDLTRVTDAALKGQLEVAAPHSDD